MDLVFQITWTVMGAILSVVLTKFLIQNGREIRKLDIRIAEIHREIVEEQRKIGEGLLRIEEGQRKGFAVLEEGQRRIEEGKGRWQRFFLRPQRS